MLALLSAGTGASRVHILVLCEARRFLVSGFWFLVSGFWFLVSGLGFVHTHVLCDARREAAIGHLLPEILKSQRPGIITLYGSNCIMTFQNFTFLADATWGLTKMAPAPTRVAPSICLRPRTLALNKEKRLMMESG
jgi:hypothetical protein